MRVIGITGRSGCGKTTVTAALRQQGYRCIDADAVARQVLAPGSASAAALLPRLQNAFGYDIVDEAGVLRRRLLADRAFATPQGTQMLNHITHPAILAQVKNQLAQARQAGERLVFLDGAALVGTPFGALCDALILVTAPYEVSVQRICARDGIARPAACRRLDAQPPEPTLRAAADYVLENNGTPQALQQKAVALAETLR